jgi:hypothetical protein
MCNGNKNNNDTEIYSVNSSITINECGEYNYTYNESNEIDSLEIIIIIFFISQVSTKTYFEL